MNPSYGGCVDSLEPAEEKVLVVAVDGSIPADQLVRLCLSPGTRLRVIGAGEPPAATTSLAGSLPDLPDIDWNGFEWASELARRDLDESH